MSAERRLQGILAAAAVLVCGEAGTVPAAETAVPRRVRIVRSLDHDWRFLKGDAPGAERTEFDDGAWRPLDVPHDWGIEGPWDEKAPTGRGGGYAPSGVSWYRKRFSVPAHAKQRSIFVELDGVMAHSDVWINGHHLGRRPSGYVGLWYELTGHLQFGDRAENVLAVRTDTTAQPASRWYTGQGIYRHVRLVTANPVHVEHWGAVVTTPNVSRDRAVVRVRSAVVNLGDVPRRVGLEVVLLGPYGKTVGRAAGRQVLTIVPGGRNEFEHEIVVPAPRLWDLENPSLYTARIRVRSAGSVVDDDVVGFGIREARFEPATGFWLNGRNVKIKGVCLHHDGGAVGAAVPLRVWERRLAGLRELGANAIRTAHNPPAPEFLDLCDRMGFLVMDELFDAWTVGKIHAEQGAHLYFREWADADASDTIRRDRNHPSIVLYSAGNEIKDTPRPEIAKPILRGLIYVIRAADPTRAITQALFRPNVSWDFGNGLADMLDVIGVNYRDKELLAAHLARPSRKIIGSEQDHERETWLATRDSPAHAGQFLWTGIDYLGEADWPSVASSAGLLDRTGGTKPRALERESWWSDRPMLKIARVEPALAESDPRRRPGFDRTSDWTPKEPNTYREAQVEIYSNCQEVELLLNGVSLGAKPLSEDASPRVWPLPFGAGVLRAVGRNDGRIAATDELRTAGRPTRLLLEVDRSRVTTDWDDVAQVTVTVVDEAGTRCPWADDVITFSLAGPGALVAVDNGDPASHESYRGTKRKAFRGRCVALVRATQPKGAITVSVSAPSLAAGSIGLEAARRPD